SCPDLRLGTEASNDHCEQFNHADSYHQHCECYRIIIEPMPPLYIHDAPPCSSISHLSDLNRESSYLCVSSCSTSAARCRGIGVQRASYCSFRHCPMAKSPTRLSPAGLNLLGL